METGSLETGKHSIHLEGSGELVVTSESLNYFSLRGADGGSGESEVRGQCPWVPAGSVLGQKGEEWRDGTKPRTSAD